MAHSFRILPRAPYSFDFTAARFMRFASENVDLAAQGQYRRLLSAGRQIALATVTDVGTVARPQLSVTLQSPSKTPLKLAAFEMQLRHILCTDLDLNPFYRLARKDDMLAPLVRRFRGLRIVSSPTLFEALVTAVLSQQVNLTFAYSIKKALVESFGRTWRREEGTYYAFPEPRRFAAQSMEDMRKFRLSTAKAGSLIRLGAAFASKTPFPVNADRAVRAVRRRDRRAAYRHQGHRPVVRGDRADAWLGAPGYISGRGPGGGQVRGPGPVGQDRKGHRGRDARLCRTLAPVSRTGPGLLLRRTGDAPRREHPGCCSTETAMNPRFPAARAMSTFPRCTRGCQRTQSV